MGRWTVVVGASAGGFHALTTLLARLDADFLAPIIVVQHLSPEGSSQTAPYLDRSSSLSVKEVDEKELPLPGRVYLAPPNYHLLIEHDLTLCLSVDPRVNYSRPSIDVLFETAAEAHLDRLVAVLLTGSNKDGTEGCRRVKQLGGTVIVQDPAGAESPVMPQSAIDEVEVDHILPLEEIAGLLNRIVRGPAHD